MRPPRSGRLLTLAPPQPVAVPPPAPQWKRAMDSHLREVVTDGSVSELERVAALRAGTLALIHVPEAVNEYELPEVRPGEPLPSVADVGGYLELVHAMLVAKLEDVGAHIARLVHLDVAEVGGCEDEGE